MLSGETFVVDREKEKRMADYTRLPAPSPEGGLNRYLQEIRKFRRIRKSLEVGKSEIGSQKLDSGSGEWDIGSWKSEIGNQSIMHKTSRNRFRFGSGSVQVRATPRPLCPRTA